MKHSISRASSLLRYLVLLAGFVPALAPGALAEPPTGASTLQAALEQKLAGFDGIFLLTDLEGQELATVQRERLNERFSPCSTFKIPHALLALDLGVVTAESSTKAWDGTPKTYDIWEQDHDLASAIRHSVVWYFQETAQEVNPQRMQAYLDRLDYGNRDISGGQTRFWLTSSLEISPTEQVRFLRTFYNEELPIEKAHQLAVQKMLIQDTTDGYQFSGKTGSCRDEAGRISGWFVGHVQSPEGDEAVFATHIEGNGDAHGRTARKISLELLRELGWLPGDGEKDPS